MRDESKDVNTGAWIFSKKRIAQKYLSGWFILDLVSVFPFFLLSLPIPSEAEHNAKQLLEKMVRMTTNAGC